MEINISELHINTFKGKHNSKGGWSTETPLGVKIVHLPTGYVVECDDFKRQHKNKAVCIEALKELLMEFKEFEVEDLVSRWLYEGG